MKKKTKLLVRDSFLSTILSCLLVSVLLLAIDNVNIFNPFVNAFTDFSLHDIYYAENFKPADTKNTQIVLVNVEQHERDLISVLIEKVIEQDPKVIGIDVIFNDLKDPYEDSLLANTLKNGKIVNAFDILESGITENHPYFQNNNPDGYVNFVFNYEPYNYVIRSFQGVNTAQGDYLSFSAQIAKQYLGDVWTSRNYETKLKKEKIIKYYGDYDKFLTLNIDDFLDYEKTTFIKDKIVIIGYLGPEQGKKYNIEDKFFTPLNKYTVGNKDRDMYGLVIHANIINMLINNDFILELSTFWIILLTFLSMFFTTMLLIKWDKKSRFKYRMKKNTYLFIHSIVMVALALFLFRYNVVVEVIPIIIGTLFAGSYVKYYKDLTRYLKKKRQWKFKTYVK